jgi:hypothetical protein
MCSCLTNRSIVVFGGSNTAGFNLYKASILLSLSLYSIPSVYTTCLDDSLDSDADDVTSDRNYHQ